MNDEYQPEITEKVRSGEYFKDARLWFEEKYETPNVHRVWLIIMSILAVICGFLGLGATFSLLPVTEHVPLYFMSQDIDDHYTTVTALQENALQIDDSVLRYHIKVYAEGRESYSYKQLEAQKALVRSMSSQDEYVRYLHYINQSNPQSPVTRFGGFGKKTARLLDTQLVYPPGTQPEQYATTIPLGSVSTLQVTTESRNEKIEEIIKVELGFVYTPIKVDQQTAEATPMHFEVSSYQVR